MYICPTCNKTFETQESVAKHSLKCWKRLHPNHKSTPAPRGEDVVTSVVDNDILSFFDLLNRG